MSSQDEEKIREVVRNQILKELSPQHKQLKERNLVANHAEEARKKIEQEVVPVLERLIGVTKGSDRDKADWVRSILEDQKDVYEELSDLESSIRGQEKRFPGY